MAATASWCMFSEEAVFTQHDGSSPTLILFHNDQPQPGKRNSYREPGVHLHRAVKYKLSTSDVSPSQPRGACQPQQRFYQRGHFRTWEALLSLVLCKQASLPGASKAKVQVPLNQARLTPISCRGRWWPAHQSCSAASLEAERRNWEGLNGARRLCDLVLLV